MNSNVEETDKKEKVHVGIMSVYVHTHSCLCMSSDTSVLSICICVHMQMCAFQLGTNYVQRHIKSVLQINFSNNHKKCKQQGHWSVSFFLKLLSVQKFNIRIHSKLVKRTVTKLQKLICIYRLKRQSQNFRHYFVYTD